MAQEETPLKGKVDVGSLPLLHGTIFGILMLEIGVALILILLFVIGQILSNRSY